MTSWNINFVHHVTSLNVKMHAKNAISNVLFRDSDHRRKSINLFSCRTPFIARQTFSSLHSFVQMLVGLKYASHSNVMEYIESKIDILVGEMRRTLSKSSNYNKLEMSFRSNPSMPQLRQALLFASLLRISERLRTSDLACFVAIRNRKRQLFHIRRQFQVVRRLLLSFLFSRETKRTRSAK